MAQPISLPLICVPEGSTLSTLTKGHRHWATANGFSGQRGRLLEIRVRVDVVDRAGRQLHFAQRRALPADIDEHQAIAPQPHRGDADAAGQLQAGHRVERDGRRQLYRHHLSR